MTKSSISLACIAFLCSAVAVACGGVEPEDLGDSTVAQSDTAGDSTEANANGDVVSEASGAASEEVDFATCVGWDKGARHCLVKCGYGWEFVGAYPNIKYGDCTIAGVRYCQSYGDPYYNSCWGWGY